MQNYKAFTLKNRNGLSREIITEVHVSLPTFNGDPNLEDLYRTTALWDTGATASVVTTDTVKSLGLKPVGRTRVNHAGGTSDTDVYMVDIYLPNEVAVRGVRVTECSQQAGSFGVIIGMDILTLGDFALTNTKDKTSVSFRVPSVREVDYVREQIEEARKAFIKRGVHKPCPCGSGSKTKDCCLKKMTSALNANEL